MSALTITLMITHAVVSLALIIIVLLQQGKQQGLSGAIAGAGETFFGKNKARTIDAMLKKFTTVVAALFIVNSIGLYFAMAQETPMAPPNLDFDVGDMMNEPQAPQIIGSVDADGNITDNATGEIMEGFSADGAGNILDADGNVINWLFADGNGDVWMDLSALTDGMDNMIIDDGASEPDNTGAGDNGEANEETPNNNGDGEE